MFFVFILCLFSRYGSWRESFSATSESATFFWIALHRLHTNQGLDVSFRWVSSDRKVKQFSAQSKVLKFSELIQLKQTILVQKHLKSLLLLYLLQTETTLTCSYVKAFENWWFCTFCYASRDLRLTWGEVKRYSERFVINVQITRQSATLLQNETIRRNWWIIKSSVFCFKELATDIITCFLINWLQDFI